MFCIKKNYFIFCFLYLTTSFSQENFTGYIEPQLAINYNITPNYSHIFSLGNRSYAYKNDALDIDVKQIDISHFSQMKINYNQSIALGIQYRFQNVFETEVENEVRITEQYNTTFKPKNIAYKNRFRAEQRLYISNTSHRFRYQFTANFPLKGDHIDVGEIYFSTASESLLSVAKSTRPRYDHRFSTIFGSLISKRNQLQIGLQYRMENYTHQLQNALFILSSLVLKL